ncbi:MAG: globin family protein [Xenococcaceae cyanobacterium MO_207.B15]|nr:globin family protein [Xenococcaceae cyanobacterium MO_207.B15]
MSLQVELLEQSFEAIKPSANDFVNSFYNNLFTANPEAKPLFATTNMTEQKKKLLGSLVLVVENLRKPEVLDDTLRGLGARHIKYGALPEHYPLVGNALLTTFEQYLKDKWTPDVKQAWIDAYGTISQMMLDGADYSQNDIALKSPSANVNTSSSSVSEFVSEPPSLEKSNSQASMTAEIVMIPDTDKAILYAMGGGGIMGIIAAILALLL